MTLAVFPTLPGIAWGITKASLNSTRVLESDSGVEYRAQNWSFPKYKFSIPIQFLRQFGSFTEYATLIGFCNSQAGQFGTWLYSDPSDNMATSQSLGVGNGSQTAYPLVRSLGGYTEPILALNTISSVKVNGTPTSAYTLTSNYGYANDTINFNSAPASSATIVATFTFYFVCRFLTDEPEFSQFIGGRSEVKSLPFQSVK